MSRNILIVDDHANFRFLIREWLRDAFPYHGILEAKSGEEAVVLASRERIDVILMDIRLPEMNGIEATRRIKEIKPQVPIVMVSGFGDPEYQAAASAAGASAYLIKQSVWSTLLPTLTALLFNSDKMMEREK